MSDLLIVTGAGATHDHREFGDNDLRPPLTQDLFDPRFAERQQRYPGVSALVGTIQTRVRRGTPLEKVLAELLERESPEIARHAREITYYLRDIIRDSTTYNQADYYDQLFVLLQERRIKFFVVTLNYDQLIERSLRRIYRLRAPWSMDTYVEEGRSWQLAKLHGSIDWAYPQSGSNPPVRDSFSTAEDYWTALCDGLPGEIATDQIELWDMFSLDDGERYLYPALAVPSDRKYGFLAPRGHVDALARFLEGGPSVLVIGNAGNDVDLLDFLRDHRGSLPREPAFRTGLSPSPVLRVVDPSEHGIGIAQRFAEAIGANGYAIPPHETFREFIESGSAETHLDMVAETRSTPRPSGLTT